MTTAMAHRALEEMTVEELQTRLAAAQQTLDIIRENAMGCAYYRSIPHVKREHDQAQYEKRHINKILLRRAHLELEVGLDRDAVEAVAA